MSDVSGRSRVSKGVSDGGRFRKEQAAERELSLDAALEFSAEETISGVESALDPRASRESVLLLLRPESNPNIVRALAASSPLPGVAETAAQDPDPIVRAIARDGKDLSPATAKELDDDPLVRRARSVISA